MAPNLQALSFSLRTNEFIEQSKDTGVPGCVAAGLPLGLYVHCVTLHPLLHNGCRRQLVLFWVTWCCVSQVVRLAVHLISDWMKWKVGGGVILLLTTWSGNCFMDCWDYHHLLVFKINKYALSNIKEMFYWTDRVSSLSTTIFSLHNWICILLYSVYCQTRS